MAGKLLLFWEGKRRKGKSGRKRGKERGEERVARTVKRQRERVGKKKNGQARERERKMKRGVWQERREEELLSLSVSVLNDRARCISRGATVLDHRHLHIAFVAPVLAPKKRRKEERKYVVKGREKKGEARRRRKGQRR